MTGAARAQDASPAELFAACELHVWPAAKLNTLTEGAVWNNVQDSAYGNKGERPVPQNVPLSPPEQLKALTDADPATLLGLKGTTIILHSEPAPRPDPQNRVRQTASTSPCYSELFVSKLFYMKSALAGRSLRSLFTVSFFDDAPVAKHVFSNFTDTDLLIFPATDPAQEHAGNMEIVGAFTKNFRSFAYKAAFAHAKR